MDRAMRNALEQIADMLESTARTPMAREHKQRMADIAPRLANDLFAIAWDIKQIARFGTPSQGI